MKPLHILSHAMNRTTGKVERELLIKTASLETRTSVLGYLQLPLYQMGFSEETRLSSLKWHFCVVYFICPGVNDAIRSFA